MNIGYTGAAGRLGLLIGQALERAAVAHRAISQRTEFVPSAAGRTVVRGSYDDPQQLAHAFEGLDRVFLVSTSEAPDERRRSHRNAIAAARRAGVAHIIFLSLRDALPTSPFPFAVANHDAEVALRECERPDWTILHPNLYTEAIFEMGGGDLERGVVTFPWPQARVGYVSRSDVAEVAASLLVDGGDVGQTLEVTGGESLTLDEVCRELSGALGRSIQLEPQSLDEYRRKLESFFPADTAAAFAGLCQALSEGRFDIATDVVRQRTGHPARTLTDVARGLAR